VSHLALSAIGADRPGIVAAVTGVLVDQGCNLEDTSMSILRGHFAMMLVVSAPPSVSAAGLEAAVGAATAPLDLVVLVRELDDDVPASPPGEDWTVSVYGADRPGIVHAVARALTDEDANIVDLTTHLIGDEDRPVYAMFIDVTVPGDADRLQRRLGELAVSLGVSCSMHQAESDIL
jgi:glycine cleavage system transcriptional repressor